MYLVKIGRGKENMARPVALGANNGEGTAPMAGTPGALNLSESAAMLSTTDTHNLLGWDS